MADTETGVMREITCEERERIWRPRMKAGELTVASASTNVMGNGLVETTWAWKDTEVECLREELQYTPGLWPDPDARERCRHWELEDGHG